jgi:hypothetical protein
VNRVRAAVFIWVDRFLTHRTDVHRLRSICSTGGKSVYTRGRPRVNELVLVQIYCQAVEGTMRPARVMLTVAFALLIFLSLPVSRVKGQTKSDDADSAAIEQVIAGYIGDFNRHDSRAMSTWFTEDSDYTNVEG